LENDTISDPPLSQLGLEEARNAKRSLEQLIDMYNLPAVEEVWVSPLQRTLQTAATIFPESSSPDDGSNSTATSAVSSSRERAPIIRVKMEIEERQSGLACDTHSSYDTIRKWRTFKRFSLSCLKLDKLVLNGRVSSCESIESSIEEEEVDCTGEENTVWEAKVVSDAAAAFTKNVLALQSSNNNRKKNKNKNSMPSTITTTAVEDKSMLRERTKKLFNLLAETNSRSICLIGHKGYLRELERGPLGYADAELFQNCEVRVYRLELDVGVGSVEVVANRSLGDVSVDSEGECDGRVGSDKTSCGGVINSMGSSAASPTPVLQRAEKIASSTAIKNDV